MKKLNKIEVASLFSSVGCEMLGDYVSCGVPIEYKCKCGYIGLISLNKFKQRLKRDEGCWDCNRHKWTEKEDEILISLYGKESREVILEKLPGITYQQLKNRSETLNLLGNRAISLSKARKGKYRKYTFDFDYFEKIKEESSYWAGFIATDGCVIKTDRVIIRLNEKDYKHLEKLQDTVLHTGLINRYIPDISNKKNKSEPQAFISFYGAYRWVEDLEKNYSIVSRKSLIYPPLKLDEVNSLAFIIGYIDGDGCIFSKEGYGIQIIGTQALLCWIKTWFDIWCPAISKRYAEVRPNKKQYGYSIAGARAKYLIKKMLSIDLPRLDRKWNNSEFLLG